jgi:hypothetical protein
LKKQVVPRYSSVNPAKDFSLSTEDTTHAKSIEEVG